MSRDFGEQIGEPLRLGGVEQVRRQLADEPGELGGGQFAAEGGLQPLAPRGLPLGDEVEEQIFYRPGDRFGGLEFVGFRIEEIQPIGLGQFRNGRSVGGVAGEEQLHERRQPALGLFGPVADGTVAFPQAARVQSGHA